MTKYTLKPKFKLEFEFVKPKINKTQKLIEDNIMSTFVFWTYADSLLDQLAVMRKRFDKMRTALLFKQGGK